MEWFLFITLIISLGVNALLLHMFGAACDDARIWREMYFDLKCTTVDLIDDEYVLATMKKGEE